MLTVSQTLLLFRLAAYVVLTADGLDVLPGAVFDGLKTDVEQLQNQLNDARSQLEKLEKEADIKQNTSLGLSYTRWGRTICPRDAVSLGAGYMSSSLNTDDGSGSNFICLSFEPQFANYTSGIEADRGNIFGTEYQGDPDAIFDPTNRVGPTFADQNVPCVSCYVEDRSSVMMLPAKKTCPDGWTLDYWGYLMSAVQINTASHTFVCVDYQPETISDGQEPEPAGFLYNVHARCGSITCPNYVDAWELTCAVCSR